MPEVAGLCFICGRPTVQTCALCGQPFCEKHIQHNVCDNCRLGKKAPGGKEPKGRFL